jgi:hypothetical protein
MAEGTTNAVVLRDEEGNLYLLDRKLIESARIPSEAQAEVEGYMLTQSSPFTIVGLTTLPTWVVFDPNGEPLWSQIRLNLTAFMRSNPALPTTTSPRR